MQLSDKIKEVVRIEDLANRLGYPVQRNGFCFSIYKQEKTPSLKLYPPTDTFYDFSSGEHGSVFDFYMGVYNVDFATAVRELGDMYGITYGQGAEGIAHRVKPQKAVRQSTENIFDCMSIDERILYEERAGISDEKQALIEVQKYRIERNAEIFEHLYLYCTERGWAAEAWEYLTNSRVLSAKSIVFFRLFFIKNYFEVNNHLKKRFDMEDLRRAGLFNLKEDGSGNLIFYHHRLIIPYLHNKKIVYLRGRYFDSDNETATSSNKYLGLRSDALGVNTPKRFYNIDALTGILPGEKVYITEGEFDAMLLEDLGCKAIAIPGVGNLPKAEKFKMLNKAEVVVCPDNDEAGSKMLDVIQKVFRDMGKEVYVKRFNEKDVTDFVKSISMDELIEEAK
jgi:DNA primase